MRDEIASLLGVLAQPVFSRSGAFRTPCPSITSDIRSAFKVSDRNSQAFLGLLSPATPIMALASSGCVHTREEATEKLVNHFGVSPTSESLTWLRA